MTEDEPGGSRIEKYYREGELHREDGPAFITTYADGSRPDKRYFRWGRQQSRFRLLRWLDGVRDRVAANAGLSA